MANARVATAAGTGAASACCACCKGKHGDHKGRHYYITNEARRRPASIVVATLAVAMLPTTVAMPQCREDHFYQLSNNPYNSRTGAKLWRWMGEAPCSLKAARWASVP